MGKPLGLVAHQRVLSVARWARIVGWSAGAIHAQAMQVFSLVQAMQVFSDNVRHPLIGLVAVGDAARGIEAGNLFR